MVRTYQAISADGHVETPPERWMKFVPEKYRDRAPRLIKLDDGGEAWQVEGLPLMHNGLNLTADNPIRYNHESYWTKDGRPRPGAGTPQQRLQEQDYDGIDAEVLYPPVYASRFIENIADRRVYLAIVQAYNDYLAEYCSVAPDRLIGNAVIPATGIEDAVAELKRCKELGLSSVSPGKFPNGSGSPKPEDDKFWETALSLGMCLSPHGTIGDPAPPPGAGGATLADGAPPLASMLVIRAAGGPVYAISQLIASGALNRFPELRFYIAETNAGWMPWSFFILDDQWKRQSHLYPEADMRMTPTEYIKKHFLFSFIADPISMKVRDLIPVDNLLWGTDFPHSAGSYPNSRQTLDLIFDGVPESVKRKILVETPCKFFGLDPNKELTEMPAVEAAAVR